MSTEGVLLSRAIGIAVDAHRYQVDKAGQPYIHHPLAVMEIVRAVGGDLQTQIVAVLHDVIEDCSPPWDRAAISLVLFGDHPLEGTLDRIEFVTGTLDRIEAIAHINGDESYRDYVASVAKDPVTALAKWADSTHNWIRLGNLKASEQSRLGPRYANNFKVLGETHAQCEMRLSLLAHINITRGIDASG